MAQIVTKYGVKALGKKFITGDPNKSLNMEETYFAREEVTTLGVRRMKKVKKPPPKGLTHKEEDILKRVKSRAYKLDMCLFNCCGIRFGWSAVIGIIPAIGDVLDFLLAYTVFQMCLEAEIPATTKAKMVRNLFIDFGIGLIPVLGDIADGVYKCNTRNAALLEEELRLRGKGRNDAKLNRQAAGAEAAAGPRPSGSRAQQEHGHRSEESDLNTQHGGPPPRYASVKQSGQPIAAENPPETRGFWSFLGRRREADLETGEDLPPPKPPRHQNSRSNGATRGR